MSRDGSGPAPKPWTDEELQAAFLREFEQFRHLPVQITLELGPITAWAVMSGLQLAIRHPKNAGPTAAMMRKVAEDLERQIAVGPAMKEVARRGWDPQHDR